MAGSGTRTSVGLGVDGDQPPFAGRNVVRPEVAQIAVSVPTAEQINCLKIKLTKNILFRLLVVNVAQDFEGSMNYSKN